MSGANFGPFIHTVRSIYSVRPSPRYVRRENFQARHMGFKDVKHMLNWLLLRRMNQQLTQEGNDHGEV